MAGILYMVATPIGNMGDITVRAIDILRHVEAVVCEDTRVTAKLLAHFDIRKPLISLHHHSSPKTIGKVTERLNAGQKIAYVSDAGTPGLADPGGKLVAAAVSVGIRVEPIPGASAVTAALSIAGLPTNDYTFLGFPPHKKGRQTFFQQVADNSHPVVLFESTHRILKCLGELAVHIPERQLVVCRELTKLHETVYRGTAREVEHMIQASSSKGEFVIVVG